MKIVIYQLSKVKELAIEYGILFTETSAKEDINISELFLTLAKKLPKPSENDYNRQSYNVLDQANENESRRCC